jgi:hypothetical protein
MVGAVREPHLLLLSRFAPLEGPRKPYPDNVAGPGAGTQTQRLQSLTGFAYPVTVVV